MNGRVLAITAYKLAVLEILFVLALSYCVSALSLNIESTDSMIGLH